MLNITRWLWNDVLCSDVCHSITHSVRQSHSKERPLSLCQVLRKWQLTTCTYQFVCSQTHVKLQSAADPQLVAPRDYFLPWTLVSDPLDQDFLQDRHNCYAGLSSNTLLIVNTYRLFVTICRPYHYHYCETICIIANVIPLVWRLLGIKWHHHALNDEVRQTTNQPTTSFGHCPSMVYLPVWPHCKNARRNRCQEDNNSLDWIVQCFTSPPTQYRLYGRRFLQVKRPNQQYQSTEGDATKEKAKNENN